MQTETQTLERGMMARRRGWLSLLLIAIGVFVLLPHLIGFERAFRTMARAQPFYLALALAAELTRYVVSAGSTFILARLFNGDVPYVPLIQAFFAGTAANRTISAGGAPGIVVRTLFLINRGLSLGSVAVLFLIEDIAGAVVGGVVLFTGAGVLMALTAEGRIGLTLALLVIGASGLVFGAGYLYARRELLERLVHAAARGVSQATVRLFGRALYDALRVQRSIDDFYLGVAQARARPLYVLASFGLNVLRYLAGMLALYFSFYAFGWNISPLVLILLSTSFSLLTTMSAAPSEVVIMGAGLAVLAFYVNVPRDVALVALLLSRSLSFWLPIPVGYLAFWNLRRGGYLS